MTAALLQIESQLARVHVTWRADVGQVEARINPAEDSAHSTTTLFKRE